jgi:hypothetical protein
MEHGCISFGIANSLKAIRRFRFGVQQWGGLKCVHRELLQSSPWCWPWPQFRIPRTSSPSAVARTMIEAAAMMIAVATVAAAMVVAVPPGTVAAAVAAVAVTALATIGRATMMTIKAADQAVPAPKKAPTVRVETDAMTPTIGFNSSPIQARLRIALRPDFWIRSW